MFSSPGPEAHLSLVLTENDDYKAVLIRNDSVEGVDVVVDFSLPGTITRTNWVKAPSIAAPGSLPVVGVGEDRDTYCDRWMTTDKCSFHLDADQARRFAWASDSPSWMSQQGARWSVLTPFIRPSNVSGGFGEGYVNAPVIDARVMVSVPDAAQVVAGPPATWDRDSGVQVFTYSGGGQVSAPLIHDAALRPLEEFALFLIAVLLGISVERALSAVRTLAGRRNEAV